MIEILEPGTYDAKLWSFVLDHLRIDESEFHPLVAQYLEAAIGRIEAVSGRVLYKRTCRLTADAFGTAIVIPASPVLAVTAVQYIDASGVTQTVDPTEYVLINRLETPTLFPSYGKSWPTVRNFPGSVSVTFDAGYGANMDDIPAPLRQAVVQTVADWFRFAGNVATASIAELPDSAYQACRPFRREWA